MSVVLSIDKGNLIPWCERAAEEIYNADQTLRFVTHTWGAGCVAKHFEKQADYSGKKWLPLSEWGFSLREHNKDRNNLQILVDYGWLRGSLIADGYEVNTATNNLHEIIYGTPIEYAHIHQEGGVAEYTDKFGRVSYHKIPQRKFMPEGNEEFTDWALEVWEALKVILERDY